MKHLNTFESFVNGDLNERFKGKDLQEPALGYIYNKKGTQVQVVNVVDKAIMMSYPSLKDAIDKEFNGQIGVDLVDRFKDKFDVEEVEVGGIYDVKESIVTEAKGKIAISMKFHDGDDAETFCDAYGIKFKGSNWVDAQVDLSDLPEMMNDLVNVHGISKITGN
jgi:hypothetical protein